MWQSPYVYGDNDPLRKTDPKGLQAAAAAGTFIATNPETWPAAAITGGAGVLAADLYVRMKHPELNALPAGGAAGAYVGIYVASQIFDGDESGSGGSGSSGKGGSGSPGGSGGGGALIGGLAAAAMQQGTQKGGNILSQFSTSTIEKAVGMVMKNINDVNHIFSAKHNLDALVKKLGGQENTIKAVLNAANGKIPTNGAFNDLAVTVEGQKVILRGCVVDGVPRIGTMFTP